MSRNAKVIIAYLFFYIIIYEQFADTSNPLWNLYDYFWPYFLPAIILLIEMKKYVSKGVKFYYGCLIAFIIYHFVVLVGKYDVISSKFIENLSGDKPVYLSTIIFMTLSVIAILYDYINKKNKRHASKIKLG